MIFHFVCICHMTPTHELRTSGLALFFPIISNTVLNIYEQSFEPISSICLDPA